VDSSAESTMTWPLVGVLLAIGVTTAMDATGLSMFSALALAPLLGLFWFLQRFSREQVGFVWGEVWHYGLAVLYPVVVLGLALLIAWLAGATAASEVDWQKLGTNFGLMVVTGVLMLILTEEGFFRGWLWASLDRAGQGDLQTLIWSSFAFAAWHWSWAVLEGGLELPMHHAPIYLVNAALMGVVWGVLRLISGSVVVASVSHSVWNAIAYSFFGAGPMEGILGIENKLFFDAEVGLVGLGLNMLFSVGLWLWWRTRRKGAAV
jgi:membrane protease YdiL (CAAX protease family)